MKISKSTSLLASMAVIVALLCVSSCASSHSGQNTYTSQASCATEPTYEADIKPIMSTQCVKCHNANKRTDGVSLDTFEGTKECFAKGEGLCTVYHDCSPMPKRAPKLSTTQLETLSCWVKSGCK